MSYIVIIPEEKETITIKTDDLKKYISDAYDSGYHDGKENGRLEAMKPIITYRDINDLGGIPVTCGDAVRTTLLNDTK